MDTIRDIDRVAVHQKQNRHGPLFAKSFAAAGAKRTDTENSIKKEWKNAKDFEV